MATSTDSAPPPKRARFDLPSPPPSASVSPDPPPRPRSSTLHRPHPLLIKPSGNALLDPARAARSRRSSLGSLATLSDELILEMLALLPAPALFRLQAVSRALFAFTRHQALWKVLYVDRTEGNMECWDGDWRRTYWAQFMAPAEVVEEGQLDDEDLEMPADGITTPDVFSDVLFQPHLCSAPLAHHFTAPTALSNIVSHPAPTLTPFTFASLYAATSTPVILTSLIPHWPCFSPSSPSSSSWSLPSLTRRFGDTAFRAEAVTVPMRVYERYCASVERARGAIDESPLYLFDSEFVYRSGGEMGREYEVPPIFGEDLFGVMGNERPDYRWLIVGPSRAGSSWHKDPNSTSAWNAVITGAKGWILFPPDIPPPGVFVSDDESEVTSPLSIAEWFNSYYTAALGQYGPRAKDPKTRGRMLQGVCREGEVMYIPAGWWHLVLNLSPCVAVTQNFVSRSELPQVLNFLQHKPDQISGFKLRPASTSSAQDADEACVNSAVYEKFCAGLERDVPGALEEARGKMSARERERSKREGKKDLKKDGKGWWDRLKEEGEREAAGGGGGFSFGFAIGEDEEEEGDGAGEA